MTYDFSSDSLQAKSYSNDKLSICSNESGIFIQKYYSDSSKGIACVSKQNSFLQIVNGDYSLKAVPVLHGYVTNNMYCAYMPYIEGLSGIDLLSSGSIKSALHLATLINMYLARSISMSTHSIISPTVLFDKIQAIADCMNYPAALCYINSYRNKINAMSTEIEYIAGPSHGDLTFSNIINKGDAFYLIDFIPSTFESPLTDIAKIDQDLLHGWSSRYCQPAVKADSAVFALHAYPSISNTIKNNYSRAYWVISVLNWLRILPYINDQVTEKLVITSLQSLLDK